MNKLKTKLTAEHTLNSIFHARQAAMAAGKTYLNDVLNGKDQYPCGFAWVEIRGIRANSQAGKALAELNISKSSYYKAHLLWNPAGLPVQNMDCALAGAEAAARTLTGLGFDAVAQHRLD